MANFTAAQARSPAPTGEVDNFVEFILHGVITNAVAFVGFIGNLGSIHILLEHFYGTKLSLNLTSYFLSKNVCFFICQNIRISFSTLRLDGILML